MHITLLVSFLVAASGDRCTRAMAEEWTADFTTAFLQASKWAHGQPDETAALLVDKYPALTLECAHCFGEAAHCAMRAQTCASDPSSTQCVRLVQESACPHKLQTCVGADLLLPPFPPTLI